MDLIGLHIVQHVAIVSIKNFYLLIMVSSLFQEVHQSLSVLSGRNDLLIDCFHLFEHVMGLVDCLVNLLGSMSDIKLSCQALCFPSLHVTLYFTEGPFILHILVGILLSKFENIISVLFQGLFHSVEGDAAKLQVHNSIKQYKILSSYGDKNSKQVLKI